MLDYKCFTTQHIKKISNHRKIIARHLKFIKEAFNRFLNDEYINKTKLFFMNRKGCFTILDINKINNNIKHFRLLNVNG